MKRERAEEVVQAVWAEDTFWTPDDILSAVVCVVEGTSDEYEVLVSFKAGSYLRVSDPLEATQLTFL